MADLITSGAQTRTFCLIIHHNLHTRACGTESVHISLIRAKRLSMYIYIYEWVTDKSTVTVGSTHNGVKNGKRYFHCARGHGALVPYTDVRKINPAETQPPVTGNFMFEGYAEVVKQRTLRRQKME